jgi:putative acetyltransferase
MGCEINEMSGINIIRTNSSHPDFIHLVKMLDAELAERDGNEHAFYDQFNKVTTIQHVVVLYQENKAVACGAIKNLDKASMEVKRMYTLAHWRGHGFATQILQELEKWAAELSFTKCVLETGKRQPEAIQLYKANGYKAIPNYGQYEGIENSVCFEKDIT